MKGLWERREEALADAKRRREAYRRERDAINERYRRATNKLMADSRDSMARLQDAAEKPVTPEERTAMLVEILMEEFDKLDTPLPVPVARVGVSGVDRLAQRLLAERGVQSVQAATFDQYRRAVRDVIGKLQSGQLSPRSRWA
jgi:hypothetical protein